jgi:alginate O-acetyltransferase complex protein AlgI
VLFVEPRYLAFFALVFCLAWLIRDNRRRKLALLLASYAFYAAWDWRFSTLIAVSTLADYFAALRIEPAQGRARDRWLVAALAVNLGLLGFFKYFGFFVDSAVELGELLGVAVRRPALEVILPVGISFFTFQSMSYTLDVHAGRLRATRSLLDVALFVAFFPQLVAGPIVRARQFLPQLATRPRFADVDVRGASALFLIGFVKKVFVADLIGGWIDPYFAAPEDFAPGSSRVAVPLFAVQIYCDFSGYTDMAIASAGLLGYRLTRNFAHPYFACDVRDFWRRWHISLSSWLRDYLYIPLGGGRGPLPRIYRNLLLTMLLGGLWHGASWTFVVWGGLHGLALVVAREWERKRPARLSLPPLAGWLLTSSWVCFAWILFRAESLGDAFAIAADFLNRSGDGSQLLDARVLALLPLLAMGHWITQRGTLRRAASRLPGWAFACGLGATAAVLVWLLPTRFAPFIYFQF